MRKLKIFEKCLLRGVKGSFTPEQETWIILEFGALRHCLAVRRTLRLHYGLSPSKVELRRAPPRDIGELKTTVNAFAESLDYANVSGTFVIAPKSALPKSAANWKESSTD